MTGLSTMLPLLVFLLAIGGFAGILAGALGVGGGMVLVPAFYYAFISLGYHSPELMQICLATSLATIVFTSVRSVMRHHRKGAVDWDLLKGWAPGVALGALAGMLLTKGLRSEVLMVLFGLLGVSVGAFLAFGRQDWRLGDQVPTGPVRWITAPLIGGLSVLMGIGGGAFAVPLMTAYGRPIHHAVATASGFGAIIALPSVAGFALSSTSLEGRPPFQLGQVNLAGFALIVSMTLLTAPLGVRLAHASDARLLRRVFALFVIVMAGNMLRKGIWG